MRFQDVSFAASKHLKHREVLVYDTKTKANRLLQQRMRIVMTSIAETLSGSNPSPLLDATTRHAILFD